MVACFILGNQTEYAYTIMGLTTIVYNKYIMSGFSPLFFLKLSGQHQIEYPLLFYYLIPSILLFLLTHLFSICLHVIVCVKKVLKYDEI